MLICFETSRLTADQGTFDYHGRCCPMAVEFYFTPELRLLDGRIIRDIGDAISFVREHEPGPGIDRRDEVLHMLERAHNKEEAHSAAHQFLRWLEELELLD
jgi:hypothetical protein